jgi:hypothetical protein
MSLQSSTVAKRERNAPHKRCPCCERFADHGLYIGSQKALQVSSIERARGKSFPNILNLEGSVTPPSLNLCLNLSLTLSLSRLELSGA